MAPKKKDQPSAHDVPDYDALKTVDDVEEEIQRHKDILVRQDIMEWRMKQDKKDAVSSYNEQLKEIKEERDHEMGVLGALEDRKKVLNATPVLRAITGGQDGGN
jgi:hypothetical protein